MTIPWLSGCRVYEPHDFRPAGPVVMPESWTSPLPTPPPKDANSEAAPPPPSLETADRWWTTFDVDGLDAAVAAAIDGNLDIRTAWSRLRQAAAVTVIAGSGRAPSLDVTGAATSTRDGDRRPAIPPGPGRGNRWDESTRLGLNLSWEVDLWGRVASQRDAATLALAASRDDVSDTALLTAGAVVDAWFEVLLQRELLALLKEQIRSNETRTELAGLRFGIGEGSAVDVLQQQQQTAATRSRIPRAEANLARARHTLAVLLGRVPGDLGPHEPGDTLPKLPPFPVLSAPADILLSRPDVRAALRRLESADRDVAVAVADRLPRLTLDLSLDFSSRSFGSVFDRDVLGAALSAFAPILDGDRRSAEVDRRKAIVQERLDGLGRTVLAALREVEDGIATERYLIDLLAKRTAQLDISRQTLTESSRRFANGLSDYTPVVVARQALESVERDVLTERTEILVNRSRLHRALGGRWPTELQPPAPRSLDDFTVEPDAIAVELDSAPAASTPEPRP